jgi:hypothetical protein
LQNIIEVGYTQVERGKNLKNGKIEMCFANEIAKVLLEPGEAELRKKGRLCGSDCNEAPACEAITGTLSGKEAGSRQRLQDRGSSPFL